MRGHSLPFGLREVVITPISEAGVLLVGQALKLPASRTFSFSETEDFEELTGDDTTVASHGSGPVVEWELEGGGISLAIWQALAGGRVVESGASPNGVRKFSKSTAESRPYFQVAGRAISDNGGDFVGRVFRCKADGDLEVELSGGSFLLTSASGKGYGREADGELYEFIENETPSALVPVAPKTGWSVAKTGTITAGTYRLALNGFSTADIAHGAVADDVEAALNALAGVTEVTGIDVSGTGTLTVTLPSAGILTLALSNLTGGSITVS